MENLAQVPESHNNGKKRPVSPLAMKVMALLLPFSGGGIAQAQNLVAATTTAPVAGETGTTPDPYVRPRNAIKWLVTEGAKSTPETSDDAQSAQNGLIDVIVTDFTGDGALNATSEVILGGLAETIIKNNPNDKLRVNIVNQAGEVLMGKGFIPSAGADVQINTSVKAEEMKPALGSEEEEEAKKARIEKEKQNREMERLVVKFNNEILKEASWAASNDTGLDGKPEINYTKNSLNLSLRQGAKGRVEADAILLPGKYELDLMIKGGSLIVWSKNPDGSLKREELSSGLHQVNAECRFGVSLNRASEVTIEKMVFSMPKE